MVVVVVVVFVYCSRQRGGVFVYWASARARFSPVSANGPGAIVRVMNRPITSTALPSVPLLARCSYTFYTSYCYLPQSQ